MSSAVTFQANANEYIICSRHSSNKRKSEDFSRGRPEEGFCDVPDSEGDSDSHEHPLQNVTHMTEIELAQVLKEKLAKLEQLYRGELERTNQGREKNRSNKCPKMIKILAKFYSRINLHRFKSYNHEWKRA